MTDIFTASNGVTVTIEHDGYLIATTDDGMCHATGGADLGIQALREYFTAERDQELGRWRDEETGLLVYQINDVPDTVFVFDETYADHGTWTREEVGPTVVGFGAPIAERFFAAHPEPKPWHNAQPGEAWAVALGSNAPDPVLVVNHERRPMFQYGSDQNGPERIETYNANITHAERIWPTGADDE